MTKFQSERTGMTKFRSELIGIGSEIFRGPFRCEFDKFRNGSKRNEIDIYALLLAFAWICDSHCLSVAWINHNCITISWILRFNRNPWFWQFHLTYMDKRGFFILSGGVKFHATYDKQIGLSRIYLYCNVSTPRYMILSAPELFHLTALKCDPTITPTALIIFWYLCSFAWFFIHWKRNLIFQVILEVSPNGGEIIWAKIKKNLVWLQRGVF